MSNSNAMTAHLWAQRDKPHGRSSNGNLSFYGPTLYSYSTPIARFVDVNGTEVVLITSQRYSVTTSGKHMPAIYRALRGDETLRFTVPELGGYYADGPSQREHEVNLAHLVAEYNDRAAKVQRMRGYYGSEASLADTLRALADTAEGYAELFGLPRPQFNPEEAARRIFEAHAIREAKHNTPAAIAKREKDRERREEQARRKAELERAEAAERVEAWRRGEPVTLRYGEGTDEAGGALLRVRGNMLETSLGAKVPLADAVRVFRFVKLCRTIESDDPNDARHSTNIVWKRNGAFVPVGHFQVDWISATGTFRAGCHLIHWSEIEQAAKAAGVFNEEPSDEAVTRHAA